MTRQEPRTGLCDGSPRFLFSGKAVAPSFTGFMRGGRRRERPRQRVWQLERCGPFRAWTKGSGAPICLPSPLPLQLHPFLAHPFQPAFQPSYCAVTLRFLPFPYVYLWFPVLCMFLSPSPSCVPLLTTSTGCPLAGQAGALSILSSLIGTNSV